MSQDPSATATEPALDGVPRHSPRGGLHGSTGHRRRNLRTAIAIGVILLVAGCGKQAPPSGAPSVSDGDVVTVAFGGDVNLGRRQNAISARDGVEAALADVRGLEEADLAIVNLESVVSSTGGDGVDKGEDAPFYFRGRPEMLNVLTAAGIDAVATANNHSGDYGPQALADQAALLDAAGIGHAGSGSDLEGACTPTLLAAGTFAVALISVDTTMPHFAATDESPGTCHVALGEDDAWRQRIGPQLETANRAAHVSLVAVHWGPNGATEPSPEKRAAGRLLVELGADAVLGSSAHVLQGIEVHEGRPIVHDAGNLLFDSQEGEADSALILLDIHAGGVMRVRIEPLISGYGLTSRASSSERERILERMSSLSAALGTTLSGDTLQLEPMAPDAAPSTIPVPTGVPTTIPAAAEPPPGCLVDDVPAGVGGEPERLGGLTLLGAAVDPTPVVAGQLVWVDSYWRVEAALSQDLWLSPRLEPSGSGQAWRGDHEPCDWAWPTSRLVPGRIYHDRVALRPREGAGDELVLRMGVTDGRETVALSGELARVPVVGD